MQNAELACDLAECRFSSGREQEGAMCCMQIFDRAIKAILQSQHGERNVLCYGYRKACPAPVAHLKQL